MADELTKDADNKKGFIVDSGFSLTTELFIDIMKLSPDKVILMSATLPTYEQLPDFYSKICDSHSGMIVKSFTSSEAKIGCALVSKSGKLYAPHHGAKTSTDIQNIITIIKSNPFIGRFYTFEVIVDMVDTFKKFNLNCPNLAEIFCDPSLANQTNIQKIAYQMLEDLVKIADDKLIEKYV